ncbi:MAG: phage tail protein [Chitinophagaceae bacterium]|nr:phage tail protein [Chitinophagaceae bacterium]
MGGYPLPVCHFLVDWGGNSTGFSEVSGLTREVEVITYREGNSPESSFVMMPGLEKYSTVKLSRGIVKGDNDFFNWINTIALNQVERRDVTISLLNEDHEPVRVWRLRNAWPCKISSSDLKAGANEVAIETLELVYDRLTIESM